MKYTKGTWEVVHEVNVQATENRRGVATCGYNSHGKGVMDENKANAHLIAAAPDMYETLIIARTIIEKEGYRPLSHGTLENIYADRLKQIDSVIAKAKGGTP